MVYIKKEPENRIKPTQGQCLALVKTCCCKKVLGKKSGLAVLSPYAAYAESLGCKRNNSIRGDLWGKQMKKEELIPNMSE